MTNFDKDCVFFEEQELFYDSKKIDLYKRYKQKIVFQMSKISIENIIQLEKQGIKLSPQEYIDLGG